MYLGNCNPDLMGFVDPMRQPDWQVTDRMPLRNLTGENVGGDIHTTVDVNPLSPSFGEPHDTLQLPGNFPKTHFP